MPYYCRPGHLDSCGSGWAGDGRAWEVDGRAQALISPGLAMLLCMSVCKHEFMQAYMYACICIHMHKHTYSCMYLNMYTFVCIYVAICRHRYIATF